MARCTTDEESRGWANRTRMFIAAQIMTAVGSKARGRSVAAPAFTNANATLALLTILLDSRGAQSGEAMPIDRALPAQILLDGERVACTRFFEAEQAASHRRHHLRLAADDPALRSRRRQVGDGERTAIRPNHIVYARTQLTVHRLLLDGGTQRLTSRERLGRCA